MPSDIKKPFGIKENRIAKGWTCQKLADVSGCSLRNIQRWENNEAVPSVLNARKLADALGVRLDDLY